LDSDFVGDLQLHALAPEARDLTVDTAGRDHLVAHLQAFEKLLHLLLLAAHRQQNDEVEDAEHERKRHELQPRAAAIGGRCHREEAVAGERAHESCGSLESFWRNATLKLSKRPNVKLSLIRRSVSR